MTSFYNTLMESYLGYCAIFVCVGLGFLFLRNVDKGEVGPGYWTISFFLNSLGFLFWSGFIPILSWQYYLIGEVLHISGFFFLVCGIYRFTGMEYKVWNLFALAAWIGLWVAALFAYRYNLFVSYLMLKGLRAVLFAFAGILILRSKDQRSVSGRRMAGWSLIAWGAYIVAFGFFEVSALQELVFGFLVGFQLLAAFGMIVLVFDRARARAEKSEMRAKKLEGLLPICSYCKKIRDKNNEWQALELYIEDRSTAEFSHGICPECMEKHRPDRT